MEEYLKDTFFLNYNHPSFDDFTKNIEENKDPKTIAIQLYYLVRDSFLYDPFHLDISKEGLKASNVLTKKRAWCVEKASVLVSCSRKFGIPSRLGYSVVTNHIGVEKLTSFLGREEIVFHGFAELFINNIWIKCTPAFDRRICAISNVSPLNWDGQTDSLFQEFDNGKRFMEYLKHYGFFSDIPIDLMNSEMKAYYPHLFNDIYDSKEFSFKHQ